MGMSSSFTGFQDIPYAFAASAEKMGGDFNPALPMFTSEEVRAHKDIRNGQVWVTFRHGVYNITDFVESHPGGDKILLAAGGGVDAFWKVYAQHFTPEVFEVLETLRIGNLQDVKVEDTTHSQGDDVWLTEPTRHPALIERSKRPFNAETPREMLHSEITPNELFFVRNHTSVPLVDPTTYRLTVCGEGLKELSLSLEDLKRNFPKHSVTSVIQCSGNRRTEMGKVGAVRGLGWDCGAVGNAVWSGARLADVLRDASSGQDLEHFKAKHVLFEGLDRDMSSAYEVSIPWPKASQPTGDVLLAYEMNGESIPRDHGYPVRAVVPGTVGARNCKWLSKVTASERESQSIYQQKDYKTFPPGNSMDRAYRHNSIQELGVQSSITEPLPNCVVDSGVAVPVKGYAWSGGGRGIHRVDLTTDGGKTWMQADLSPPKNQEFGRTWGWTLFEANVPVPSEISPGDAFQVCSRAVDSATNVQPEAPNSMHHIRGMLCNSWHCVPLVVDMYGK